MANHTFQMERGDTFLEVVAYKDSAGVAINIVDWVATFTVIFGEDETVYTDTPNVVITGASGLIQLYISATDTADFPSGRGRYRLRVEDPDASPEYIKTLLEGRIEVT